MRRLVAIIALVATGGLVTACGSSSHPAAATDAHVPTGTQTPPATRPSKSAAKPLAKTQAIAFARAVNLTAADVPGFKATQKREQKHETAVEKQLEYELMRCVGGAFGSSAGLADVSSEDFKLEKSILHFSVSSDVNIAQTPALAAKELSALHSNHVRICLSHYLNLLLKDQLLSDQKSHTTKSQKAIDPSSISISISQGTPPAPGASGSFAWLITATITMHSVRLPFFYLDILGFVYGPARVSLISSGALKRFPAADQEDLYRLLLKRTKAHSASVLGAPGASSGQ